MVELQHLGRLLDRRHHQQADRVTGLHGRQAAHPTDPAVGLRGEPLEVGHRDGASTGAQRLRTATLDVLDRLGVDATAGGQQVLHPGDVRQRRLQRRERVGTDVAGGPSPAAVGVEPDSGAFGRDGAVLAHRAVRIADQRAEPDLAGVGVPGEVQVVAVGVDEVADLDPLHDGPVVFDLERLVRLPGQHRGVAAPERLVGLAGALADDVVDDHPAVFGRDGAAHALGGDAAELRRGAVGGPIRRWPAAGGRAASGHGHQPSVSGWCSDASSRIKLPSRLSPPVVSATSSGPSSSGTIALTHPSPCQVSQTSGGRPGLTPMPSTLAWMLSRIALPASEFSKPM